VQTREPAVRAALACQRMPRGVKKCLIEGVETEAERAFLQAHGYAWRRVDLYAWPFPGRDFA